MGKINGCLKALFISFNTLFTVIGGLLIFGLIKMTGVEIKMGTVDAPSTVWVWVFAIGILGISLLGSHAARTENKTCLKVFAGFMGISMALMLICGIAVGVLKNQAKETFGSDEVTREFLKDDQAQLKFLQQNLDCCGWTGVQDWTSSIPSSCSCDNSYGEKGKCKSAPEGLKGPSTIYSKSCRDVVWDYAEFGFTIILCILFGFLFIALMGLIIAVNMIKQISRHDSCAGTAMAMRAY